MFPAWGHLCFQVRCSISKAFKSTWSSVNICQILNELSNKKFSFCEVIPQLPTLPQTSLAITTSLHSLWILALLLFRLPSTSNPLSFSLVWPMGPNQTSNLYGYLRIRLVIKMASPVYHLSSLDSYSLKFQNYVDRNPNIAWWYKRCPQWPLPPGLHALISLSLRVGWT